MSVSLVLAFGVACKSTTTPETQPPGDTSASASAEGETGDAVTPEGDGSGEPAGESGGDAMTGGQRALAVLDALQKKIDDDTETKSDRKQAHEQILEWDDGSAEYAFARAALAGRRAQAQGMKAGGLVEEAESFARRSIERDPGLREGAAQRLLGSLYVLAPGRMVQHGDSESGLEMLEEDVEAHPDRADSHLRVAEAYIALDDPEPAFPHLCFVLKAKGSIGGEDQRLLAQLIKDVGGESTLGCG